MIRHAILLAALLTATPAFAADDEGPHQAAAASELLSPVRLAAFF